MVQVGIKDVQMVIMDMTQTLDVVYIFIALFFVFKNYFLVNCSSRLQLAIHFLQNQNFQDSFKKHLDH
jgi:hypothetical protein